MTTDLATLFDDLVRVEIELWARLDERLQRDHELPLSWFEPMQVMERVPECRVADIARSLAITEGGASKLVDRIERAGWCRRAPHPSDARSCILRLTPAGRSLLERARMSFDEELSASVGAALTPGRLASLAVTMGSLRRSLATLQGSA